MREISSSALKDRRILVVEDEYMMAATCDVTWRSSEHSWSDRWPGCPTA